MLLATFILLVVIPALCVCLFLFLGPVRRIGRMANVILVGVLGLINGIGSMFVLKQLAPGGPWSNPLYAMVVIPIGTLIICAFFYLYFSARYWASGKTDKNTKNQ